MKIMKFIDMWRGSVYKRQICGKNGGDLLGVTMLSECFNSKQYVQEKLKPDVVT